MLLLPPISGQAYCRTTIDKQLFLEGGPEKSSISPTRLCRRMILSVSVALFQFQFRVISGGVRTLCYRVSGWSEV